MKTYEHIIISNFEWPQTLKIAIPKKQAVHHVIFLLQYEMWQQDGLMNMEAGQTECRIPEAYFQFPSSTWEVLNSKS